MKNQFETILMMHPKQAPFLNIVGIPILHMTYKKLCIGANFPRTELSGRKRYQRQQ